MFSLSLFCLKNPPLFSFFHRFQAVLVLYIKRMSLHIARKRESERLLHDPQFRRQWIELYENCPWGTVFQDVDYLSIWYRNFKERVELIFIYESDQAENIIGLFPISRCIETGKLTIAGDYHAEYQTWLATPENGDKFAEKALNKLCSEFPTSRLQLMFLAPNTPKKWFEGKWANRIRLQRVPRPLVNLDERNTSEQSLRKRGNKSRIRQLRKRGELSYSVLECPDKFSKVFDEIESNSHLRLSALHNVQCGDDEARKSFHEDLMRETDIVYPTLLTVDDDIASAQVCFRNKDEMLLCLTSMSPFYGRQSPSKIHLLMLGQELAKTSYKNFDLSPGNGYKERFATETLDSYTLTIFFRRSDYFIHTAKRKALACARNNLARFEVKKNSFFKFADKLLHKVRRVRPYTIPQTIFKNIGRKMYQHKECRMYSFDIRKIGSLENPNLMNVDSIPDLLKYRPVEGWQDTTSQFHQKVLRNFENGIHSYSLADENQLLHYGWLIERQEISQVFEVDQEFKLPENTAVLFDYFTHPEARGKGLYQKSILQGLHDASKIDGTKQVFIGVMADNASSRHVIEKLGFRYEGSLFEETKLGTTRRWQDWSEKSQVSEFEPVSTSAFAT